MPEPRRHYAALGATTAEALVALAQGLVRDGERATGQPLEPILSTLERQAIQEATVDGRAITGGPPARAVRLVVEVEW